VAYVPGGIWEFDVYIGDREAARVAGDPKLGTVRAPFTESGDEARAAAAAAGFTSGGAGLLIVPVAMVCAVPGCPAGDASRVHANDAEGMACSQIADPPDDGGG